MTAPIIVVRTNVLCENDVLVGDIGAVVPASGGSISFDDDRSVEFAAQSQDLRDLCTDDAYGVGSSTLILNDGSVDVDQNDIEDFLDTRRTDWGAAYKIERLTTDWPDGKLPQTSGGSLIPVDPGTGGSTVPTYYFEAYSLASVTVPSGGVDLPLTNERVKDAIYTHLSGSPEVIVGDASTYLVFAKVVTDISTYSNRSASMASLYLDSGSGYTAVPGVAGVNYNRITNRGATTLTAVGILQLAAGDKLKLRAWRSSGGSTIQATEVSLSVVRIGSGIQHEAFVVTGGRRNNATNIYLWGPAGVPMNVSGVILPFNARLVALAASTLGNETWSAEVRRNGLSSPIDTLPISGTRVGYKSSSVDVVAGDEIQLYCNGSSVGWPVVAAYFERAS